jgi:YHYH protein
MLLSISICISDGARSNYASADRAISNDDAHAADTMHEAEHGDTSDVAADTMGFNPQSLWLFTPQVNPSLMSPSDRLQAPQGCQPAATDQDGVLNDSTSVHSHDTSHGGTTGTTHDHSTTPTTASSGANGDATDPTNLPLGDGKYSYDGPQRGYIYLDRETSRIDPNNAAGSSVNGPWIRSDGTYDSTSKVVVEGEVEWPSEAQVTLSPDGQTRTISTNDLPGTSGVFPIASDSQAYQYDRNPNTIQVQNLSLDLPTNPTANAESTPLTGGAIGFVYADESKTSMVALYAGVDEKGNDAVAHEVQDSNKGHPQQSGEYHFHSAPESLKDAEGVIGYALDGFPIMGSMENGQKVSNADLDENHGKMTTIQVDGKEVETYAYYATDEYPYTIGAFKGTPAQVQGEIKPPQTGGDMLPSAGGQNGVPPGGLPAQGNGVPPSTPTGTAPTGTAPTGTATPPPQQTSPPSQGAQPAPGGMLAPPPGSQPPPQGMQPPPNGMPPPQGMPPPLQ